MENLPAGIVGLIVAFEPSAISLCKRYWNDDHVSLAAIDESPGVVELVNRKGVSREILLQCALKDADLLELFFKNPWNPSDEWLRNVALLLARKWGSQLLHPLENGPSIWKVQYWVYSAGQILALV